MEQEFSEKNGWIVITFRGDIDFNSSPDARKVLLAAVARERDLLVDLTAVTYIDSSGIACLIEAYQGAKAKDRRFALVGIGGAVMRVLKLAHLDRVFTIHPTLADAGYR